MELYEEIKTWVARVAGVAAVDSCGHQPEEMGLFPQGVQLLRAWEDVAGNRYRQVRYGFLLRLILPPGESAAKTLLRIQAQAAVDGYAATEGKLVKAGSDGLGIYEIRLTAEREEHL